MTRAVLLALCAATGVASAQTAEPAAAPAAAPAVAVEPPPDPSLGDQGIGASLGLAAGGRSSAGGARITGHYLYQLSDTDWFDGIASFTFGSGAAGCFRDRADAVICEHGPAAGGSIEIAAGVRRLFRASGRFRPFVRGAIGLAMVRFSDDELTGVAIPLHAGAGLRAAAGGPVAVIVLADATLGIARFGRGLGTEPQLGLAVTIGAEIRLR